MLIRRHSTHLPIAVLAMLSIGCAGCRSHPAVPGVEIVTEGHQSPGPVTDERANLVHALRSLALSANTVGDFVDPELGVFVLHNTTGCCPPIDHVTRWPQGQLDWADYLDDSVILAVLADAAKLPTARDALVGEDLACEVITGSFGASSWRCQDAMGCEPHVRYLEPRGYTPLDVWAATVGGIDETTGDSLLAADLIALPVEELKRFWDAPEATLHAYRRATEVVRFEIAIDGMELYFGRLRDKWRLVAIDLVEPACG